MGKEVASWLRVVQITVSYTVKSHYAWASHPHQGHHPALSLRTRLAIDEGSPAARGGEQLFPMLQDKNTKIAPLDTVSI